MCLYQPFDLLALLPARTCEQHTVTKSPRNSVIRGRQYSFGSAFPRFLPSMSPYTFFMSHNIRSAGPTANQFLWAAESLSVNRSDNWEKTKTRENAGNRDSNQNWKEPANPPQSQPEKFYELQGTGYRTKASLAG